MYSNITESAILNRTIISLREFIARFYCKYKLESVHFIKLHLNR